MQSCFASETGLRALSVSLAKSQALCSSDVHGWTLFQIAPKIQGLKNWTHWNLNQLKTPTSWNIETFKTKTKKTEWVKLTLKHKKNAWNFRKPQNHLSSGTLWNCWTRNLGYLRCSVHFFRFFFGSQRWRKRGETSLQKGNSSSKSHLFQGVSAIGFRGCIFCLRIFLWCRRCPTFQVCPTSEMHSLLVSRKYPLPFESMVRWLDPGNHIPLSPHLKALLKFIFLFPCWDMFFRGLGFLSNDWRTPWHPDAGFFRHWGANLYI